MALTYHITSMPPAEGYYVAHTDRYSIDQAATELGDLIGVTGPTGAVLLEIRQADDVPRGEVLILPAGMSVWSGLSLDLERLTLPPSQ